MLKQIEKLREKPESYRTKVAFIISASIAGVIFIVWLSVVGVRLGGEEEIVKDEGPSLVAGVKSGFSEVFEEGREQLGESRRELEGIFQQ